MSLTFCNVRFSQASEPAVYMSGPLMKQLNLSGRRRIRIKLGKEVAVASVRPLRRAGGNQMYLTSGLRHAMRVPKAGHVYVYAAGDNEVQIGPLVGVLTDAGPGSRSSSAPFGTRTSFIRELLRLGEKKAYFFAFTPQDIDWGNETVLGYFVSPQGGWYRKTVPLPDVVYNRLPSRRAETSTSIAALRERFVRKKIPFFNWSFFNKSDVYRLLDNDPEANRHLPESVVAGSQEQMRTMLEKHKFVYFKPTAGSLGIGIYRLTYQPGRGYFARYRSGGRNVLLRFASFGSLARMLRSRHGSSLNRYVIQQGIRLVEIDGCPIDFRFHMHKNGKNEWVVAGIGAKKAGRGSVTTHIKNGGSLMTPDKALRSTFGDRAEDVLDKAKRVAVRMSEAIERNYPHTLGELGLDIGIDKDGDVWMFEANAKPGRSIFKHPALKEQGKASMSYILEHCLYLSKFRRRDG